ncbi:MAG TPA: bifunctional rhamnulose-1-phosphate aldolase/short-chain dehydrogenase [Dongiaceae bacterium]|nr:bifunctional rhamnulose-1-phosphate aldolase/short-chain dehydrogenase [Dongiaceae bacterium]
MPSDNRASGQGRTVESLWKPEEAGRLRGVDLLAYRSRLIGRDPSLVLYGAGNTSLKQEETDFRGRVVRVLRIKGSGADLAGIGPDGFPGLRLEDLEPLRSVKPLDDEAMVDWLRRALVDPDARRPSIETLLHAFLPAAHVDHTHADAILALTDTRDPRRHVETVFGEDAVLVPYRRPGHRLAQEVAEAAAAAPKARAVLLEKHGLITWGDDARACYETTLAMVRRAGEYVAARSRGGAVFGALVRPPRPADERRRAAARLLPRLRGLLTGRNGGAARLVLHFDDAPETLDFVGREAAGQVALAGPATPDHLMYVRARPLVAAAPPPGLPLEEEILRYEQGLEKDMVKYAAWYEIFARKHGGAGGGPVDTRARVVLLPGLGMVAAGRDARHAALVAEVYRHGIAVMQGAQALGEYRSLALQDCHDVEYWPLELYRMSLQPAARELSGRVALVTGAARGIGRAIALRLAREGCHVVVSDLAAEATAEVAAEIVAAHGAGRALAAPADVTDEAAVAGLFEAVVLEYGGLDIVVSNAGIAHVSPIDRMEVKDWRRSFEVNATGHFLVARSATRLLKSQGQGGSLIFVASKNVLAPGKDFGAYSASKAAEAQLARVLAIENGAAGVRVNLINPDAVFGDSGLWSQGVREERARAHGIRPDELEEFYRKRNLLGTRVSAEDVAEAALWLAGDRSSRTTGCILTVDGGVREAFPR